MNPACINLTTPQLTMHTVLHERLSDFKNLKYFIKSEKSKIENDIKYFFSFDYAERIFCDFEIILLRSFIKVFCESSLTFFRHFHSFPFIISSIIVHYRSFSLVMKINLQLGILAFNSKTSFTLKCQDCQYIDEKELSICITSI
jgi:hypothetical protein